MKTHERLLPALALMSMLLHSIVVSAAIVGDAVIAELEAAPTAAHQRRVMVGLYEQLGEGTLSSDQIYRIAVVIARGAPTVTSYDTVVTDSSLVSLLRTQQTRTDIDGQPQPCLPKPWRVKWYLITGPTNGSRTY